MSCIVAFCSKHSFYIPKVNRSLILMRSITATIALTSITFAIPMIPITVQITIFQTAPFWTTLLAWMFLGDRILRLEVVAMVICFCAIVFISTSSPGAEEDPIEEAAPVEESDKYFTGNSAFIVGCILVLVTSWGFSINNVINRKLQNTPFTILNFYYCIVAFTVTGAYLLGEYIHSDEPLRLLSLDRT